METLCIRCGESKSWYGESCAQCKFTPQEPIELAKSRILSVPWSFELPEGGAWETGRSREELKQISVQLKAAQEFAYPSNELEAVVEFLQLHSATSKSRIFRDVALWLVPPIVLMAIAVIAIYIL